MGRQVHNCATLSPTMVSLVSLVLIGVVLVGHTLIAAVMTRFFRIRMHTQWGSVLYALALIPVALVVSTLVFGQVVAADFGVPTLLGLWVGMPLALGFTVDVLYMEPPKEYDLPQAR